MYRLSISIADNPTAHTYLITRFFDFFPELRVMNAQNDHRDVNYGSPFS